MHSKSTVASFASPLSAASHSVLRCLALAVVFAGGIMATETGGSVYPAGVETILPGVMPHPGAYVFEEFNNFYEANTLAGPKGGAVVPGFHLRASAVAAKLIHNWGVHVLGGTLINSVAVPAVDLHLTAPFGRENKVGIGNPDIETGVAYKTGDVHWWYGYDVLTPGFSYKKTDLVNVGQHNYASGPSGAITYLPNAGQIELSSRFQYLVNYSNDSTSYRSGNEFIWEYAGMVSVTKRLALGGNGYYYQQTTDDTQNGAVYLGGNRGRDFAFGPEIRYHFRHYAMILKYEKDFVTENRPAGTALWLQIGVPFGHPRE